MNTTGISGSNILSSLNGLNGPPSLNSMLLSKKAGATDAASSGPGKADSAELSKPAEMISKLEQLKASDSEKFTQVVSDIASKLKDAADQESGFGAEMLSNLAEKFQNVADGGDLSQLQPPPPPGSSSGMQGMVRQYLQQSQQDPTAMVNHSKSREGHDKIKSIMTGIFDEVDKAISGTQGLVS